MDLFLHPNLVKSNVSCENSQLLLIIDLMVKASKDVYEASLGEGEPFGKPVHTRDPDKCVSEEISHLVKDKDYEQKRAIAAAYSICKHPEKRSKKSIDLLLEC